MTKKALKRKKMMMTMKIMKIVIRKTKITPSLSRMMSKTQKKSRIHLVVIQVALNRLTNNRIFESKQHLLDH